MLFCLIRKVKPHRIPRLRHAVPSCAIGRRIHSSVRKLTDSRLSLIFIVGNRDADGIPAYRKHCRIQRYADHMRIVFCSGNDILFCHQITGMIQFTSFHPSMDLYDSEFISKKQHSISRLVYISDLCFPAHGSIRSDNLVIIGQKFCLSGTLWKSQKKLCPLHRMICHEHCMYAVCHSPEEFPVCFLILTDESPRLLSFSCRRYHCTAGISLQTGLQYFFIHKTRILIGPDMQVLIHQPGTGLQFQRKYFHMIPDLNQSFCHNTVEQHCLIAGFICHKYVCPYILFQHLYIRFFIACMDMTRYFYGSMLIDSLKTLIR